MSGIFLSTENNLIFGKKFPVEYQDLQYSNNVYRFCPNCGSKNVNISYVSQSCKCRDCYLKYRVSWSANENQ